MKKLYGAGMKFFATKEDYKQTCKDVAELFPLATVELIEREKVFPKISLEKLMMFGLIDNTKNILSSYLKENEKQTESKKDIEKNNNGYYAA